MGVGVARPGWAVVLRLSCCLQLGRIPFRRPCGVCHPIPHSDCDRAIRPYPAARATSEVGGWRQSREWSWQDVRDGIAESS